jgi:hypothetical protein
MQFTDLVMENGFDYLGILQDLKNDPLFKLREELPNDARARILFR